MSQIECPVAYSVSMSKDRKEIYISAGLRRAIEGRRDSLTTAVNLIAARYQAIVEVSLPDLTVEELAMVRESLEFVANRVDMQTIIGLPAIVGHAMGAQNRPGHQALVSKLASMRLHELVAIIDRIERGAK